MMIQKVSLLLISLLSIGNIIASPVRYIQPVYQQHPQAQYAPATVRYHAPAQHGAVRYVQAPSQYQAVPVVYRHAPVQYHQVRQPQYQTVPVAHANIVPATHLESAAHNHNSHGQQSAGHSASGHTQHGDKAVLKESAETAHGHHNVGGHNSHSTQGANQNYHGTYQDVGSYSQDKGSGFEKSYSYDTASGFHDITAENSGNSQSHGSLAKEEHHNIGSQSSQLQEKKAARESTGSSEHSVLTHNNALFKKYGYTNSGNKQGYSYSPVYGFGFH